MIGRVVARHLIAADADRNVLLRVQFEADRWRDDAGLHLRAPELLACLPVIGAELMRAATAVEHDIGGGGERATGRAFVGFTLPRLLAGHRIDGLQVTD